MNGSRPAGSRRVKHPTFKLRLSALIVTAITYGAYAQDQPPAKDIMASFSGDIPTGFEGFFSRQTGQITINLYGEQIRVPGQYSLRSASIDASARANLERFFSEYGVQPRILTPLVDALITGVDSSPQCKGLITTCALYPTLFDFVFIDDTRELKVFINETEMSLAADRRYFDPDDGKISLVNTTQFYAQVSDGDPALDWQNSSNLALPVGYIQSDTALLSNNENTDFEVYEANYVIDRKGYSIQAGYDRTPNIENSASAITMGQNTGGYHLTLFSNDRLAARSRNQYDTMPVFVAETTELEILRGDRVIYRTILNQGLNNINYSTFEQGSYNVVLRYMVGGRVVREENRQIYNIPFFSMDKGDYDWFGQAGELKNDDFGDYAYVKGGFSGRFTDNALLGAGYNNTGGDSLLSAYGEVIPLEGMRSSLLVSSDFDATTYLNAHTSYYSAFANGEYMRTNKDTFRSLYGSNDFSQMTVGFAFHGLGAQHSLSYQNFVTEEDTSRLQAKGDISSVIFNTTKAFRDFNLSANLQHDKDNTNRSEDGWMVGVSIDVPLDDFRVASSYNRSRGSSDRMRNALQYNTDYDENTSVNAEVAITNHDNEEGSVPSGQVAAYHTNDTLNASTNIYVESADRYNASVNLSSTQLINSESLMLTSDRAESFVVMDSASLTGLNEGESVGLLEMRNRSNNQTAVIAMNKTRRIIPVDTYNQYQMNLETGNSQYMEVEDEEHNYYAKPGTFLQKKNNMMRIKRYIVSFANKNGRFVHNVECSGLACHEVESIGDGVYQISLFENFDFTLKSGNDICLLPNGEDKGKVFNVGRSLCMDPKSVSNLIKEAPSGHRLYYMGASRKVDKRQSSNTKFVPVGDYFGQFLFAKENDFKPVGGVTPRLVQMPGNAFDNHVVGTKTENSNVQEL